MRAHSDFTFTLNVEQVDNPQQLASIIESAVELGLTVHSAGFRPGPNDYVAEFRIDYHSDTRTALNAIGEVLKYIENLNGGTQAA